MQIELKENKKVYGFDFKLNEDILPLDKELTISLKDSVDVKGSLELLNNKLGWLKFDITGDVTYPCSRCLEEVKTPVDYTFNEEVEIVDDKVFELDNYILDCLYINEPSQILCKEDCKGLCPICGNNLNISECNCEAEEEEEIDPRLAALKQLL